METTGDRTPEAQDPRASLQEARQAEDAIRRIDTPWWYFVLSAVLFAGLILAQLLGDNAPLTMLLAGVGVVALNWYASQKAGVMGSSSRNRGFLTCVTLIFVVFVASFFGYRATDEAWVVVVGAVAAAALMLLGGVLYRRNPS